MKNAGRIIAFLITIIVLVAAVSSIVTFVKRSAPSGNGGVSVTLPGLSAPDKMVIGLYLDSKAGELEQPAGNDDTPVPFTVETGETVAEIAARLEQEGLVSDAQLFRRYTQYHEMDSGIEAGDFTLRQTMTIPEIAQALQRGQRPEQTITIQEGLRLEQVAAQVAEQTAISQQEFLALATTGWRDQGFTFDFLTALPPEATLEGFLFPETYRLPENPAAIDVLRRMLGTFDARVTPEMRAAAADRGLTVYELVTLASIVEREAVLDSERPIIAGVYLNRVTNGWFLNADPTTQYALNQTDDWWPVLTLQDLEVDSPYNTYKNPGLPPGPICSPGLASIQASANPAQTDYFFFLANCIKNDGSHLFAVTQEEHNANYQMCGGQIP